MSTGWIDVVMRTNAQVVAAEACFHAQVIRVVEITERGEDSTRAEALLDAYRTNLALLRAIQTEMLQSLMVSP